MDRLIPIINKLQDVFTLAGSQPVDLPQIAVVGSQSVGKSSVLENIVGRDFLPRGSNIVTRRPLILQLFNTSHLDTLSPAPLDADQSESKDDDKKNTNANNGSAKDGDKKDTWGEFLHTGAKRYYDFEEIRGEIAKETDRVAPNKAIAYDPINLKIYSPDVLTLTLIDLPGMTRVPVENQPPDIERRIRKLIRSFITKKNCLILAVSAATADLATSDAIQLAKEVDPAGVRTLGVITKIDLMDAGTNALSMLRGDIIPLQLGYIGVVNRSQKDIHDHKAITDAQSAEKLFFKSHAAYRQIAHVCGTPYLAYKLNQILINHIKRCLPSLKQSMHESIEELKLEIVSYGRPIALSGGADDMGNNKGALLLHLISKFSENFSDCIDGANVNDMMLRKQARAAMKTAAALEVGGGGDESQQAKALFGGARILYIFRTEFHHHLARTKSFDGLSDQFIVNSMRNASGIRSALFIPEMCFENLVKMQIEKLRQPCMQCVDLVFSELKRIAAQSETTQIARFKHFKESLHECVTRMLQRHLEPCRRFVDQVIDIELAYVNTNHPDFISMDDVFTERANHHSQNEMYKQIGGNAYSDDEEAYHAQQRQSQQQQQRHHQRQRPQQQQQQQQHMSSSQQQQQQQQQQQPNSGVKSAPAPPSSQLAPANAATNANGGAAGGGGWFGLGASRSKTKQSNRAAENNPFSTTTTTDASTTTMTATTQTVQQQQQAKMQKPKARRSSNSKAASHSFNDGYPIRNAANLNATKREEMELLVIKRFIASYFKIVKKNIADLVPKSIMFMLVNKSKQRLQQDLALALYKEDQFEKLLSEDPEIARKRKDAQELLAILQKALNIINEVSDYRVDNKAIYNVN